MNGLARHVRIAAITTTKRALPVSESNGPFPCPSPDIELSWRLESNQTLCLARQYPHRCVPDSSRASHLFAALHVPYNGREYCRSQLEAHSFSNKPIPTGKKGNALSCCVPAFFHVRRGGSWLFPNNKDSVNLDIPDNEKVKQSDC